MSEDSLAHRIHVSLGKAFHHKHHSESGTADLQDIASEHDVSEDQVREQLAYLRNQNLVAGPMGYAGAQVSGVPAATFEDMHMTNEGLAWAAAGFPVL